MKAAEQRADNNYDADYAAYQRAENMLEVGGRLQKMGFHIDAIRLYRDLMNDNALAAAGQYRGDPHYFTNRARQLLQAPADLSIGDSAATAMELLAPQERQDAPPTLDLLLSVSAGELSQSRVSSLLFTLLDPKKLKPEARPHVRARLKETSETIPEDVHARVFAAYLSLNGGEDDAKARLAEVVGLVEQKPLEEIPAGKRANCAAARGCGRAIGLVAVGARMPVQKDLAREGGMLARCAVEAAKRQLEPNYYRSMLFEWGQIAVANGQKQKAEELWTELLDNVVARPGRSGAQARTGGTNPASTAPAAAPAVPRGRPAPSKIKGSSFRANGSPFRLVAQVKDTKRPAFRGQPVDPSSVLIVGGAPASSVSPAAPSGLIPPLTLSQFQSAMAIAKAAAENDMPALSLRAARVAGRRLANCGRAAERQRSRRIRSRRSRQGYAAASASYNSGWRFDHWHPPESGNENTPQVIAQFAGLSSVWQRKSFPSEDVFRLFMGVVFPPHQPDEIHFYPLTIAANSDPTSVGRMLVEWCVRARREAELKKEVAVRQSRPDGRLAGQVLLVQLGLATRDKTLVEENLTAIGATLATNRLQALVDLACHAALPAFEHDQYARSALPVIDAALSTPGFQESPAMQPLAMKAVRHHLRNKDAEAAQKRLDAYLAGRQGMYARYGGDSAISVQRQDLAAIAAEAARGGLASLALDYLGRMADMPAGRQAEPAAHVPLWHIREELARMPAEQAYALLRDWTLPTENRNVVRLVAAFAAGDILPAHFAKDPPLLLVTAQREKRRAANLA